MEDTSLEEFLESSEDTTAQHESDSDHDTPANEGTDERTDPEPPEPAVVTSRWYASEGVCDRCNTESQRLWTDGEAAVCTACKEW